MPVNIQLIGNDGEVIVFIDGVPQDVVHFATHSLPGQLTKLLEARLCQFPPQTVDVEAQRAAAVTG